MAELLAEVVLRIESAAAGDLRHAEISLLEQARSFLEALLLEEVAEKAPGEAVESARYVLPGVSELPRNRFDGHLFVRAKATPNRFDERSKKAVNVRLLGSGGR